MPLDHETEDYKVRQYGQITVIRLKHPNFSGQIEVNRVGEELKAMVDGGALKMVLCFKHVQHCGSAGLGLIIGLNKKLNEAGGRLVISHPETIAELLRISKTASMFKTAPDPNAARELF